MLTILSGGELTMFLSRNVKWVLVFLLALVVGKLVWSHRQDDWGQQWLRPQGPAKSGIQFDNGTVRQTATLSDSSENPPSKEKTVKNEPGQLKKCLSAYKVVYTDQVCPPGSKVGAVDGGTLAVLPSPKSAADNATGAQGGQKRLRDALDISDSQSLRDKRMERVVNP